MKEFFLTGKRVRKTVIIAIVLFLTVFPAAFRKIGFEEQKIKSTRTAIGESMVRQMNTLSSIGVKMQYAGADIENELLPKVRLYSHSLKIMNDVCYKSYGEEYTPVDMGFMRHLSSAVNELEACYLRGENAKTSEKTLSEYLVKLGDISAARFDEEMDILPFKKK